jgi:hypothetical protein
MPLVVAAPGDAGTHGGVPKNFDVERSTTTFG